MRYLKEFFRIIHELRTLFLLLSTQLISGVFTIIKDPPHYVYPDDDPYTQPFFYLVNVEVTPNTYLYFFFQRLGWILIGSYIVYTGQRFLTALWVFLVIQAADLIDYVLSYNWVWMYIGEAPISWNVLKCVVFMLAIANEFLTLSSKRLQIE